MEKATILFVLVLLFSQSSSAQDLILNGSFEGLTPALHKSALFWFPCGDRSTPDLQPITTAVLPEYGETYVGLVARGFADYNEEKSYSRESVTQKIDGLLANKNYRLGVYLTNDDIFKFTGLDVEVTPGKLNIYLGKDYCDTTKLIWQSPIIDHSFEWRKYEFEFNTDCDDGQFLTLEAMYGDSSRNWAYILIDSVSVFGIENNQIDLVDCDNVEEDVDTTVLDTIVVNEGGTECRLYFPNAFTPNGDGINDIFTVYKQCSLLSSVLQIFDRWGSQVFFTTNSKEPWTGKIGDTVLEQGLYIYQFNCQYLDENGRERQSLKAGTIMLLN